MSERERPSPASGGVLMPLAAVLFLALVAIVLILNAELAPAGAVTRSGPYGYLTLQAAGALGLVIERRRAPWAAIAMTLVFALNLICFVLIFSGVLGPDVVLIAFELLLLFVSGILGALATLVSVAWIITDGPRPSIFPAVIAAIVATMVVSTLTARGEVPPPTTPAPIVVRSSPASVTPTPTTPSPTASKTFPLVIRIVGNGAIVLRTENLTCRDTCTYSLREGTVVTLTAQPASDSIFATWAGCRTPCQLLMDRARAVQATFRFPTLLVSLEGKGRGTVRSEPNGIVCPGTCEVPFARGIRLALTAIPESPAGFTGWTGPCAGFGTCEFAIGTDSEVTAEFEPFAGAEYEAKSCGQSASPQRIRQGEPATVSACFANIGKVSWTRGTTSAVELWQCCPLGGPSSLSAWSEGWQSERVYAGLTSDSVGPNQQGTAIFKVRAPANAAFGDQTFYGYLVEARSGAPIRGGAFSIVVTIIP